MGFAIKKVIFITNRKLPLSYVQKLITPITWIFKIIYVFMLFNTGKIPVLAFWYFSSVFYSYETFLYLLLSKLLFQIYYINVCSCNYLYYTSPTILHSTIIQVSKHENLSFSLLLFSTHFTLNSYNMYLQNTYNYSKILVIIKLLYNTKYI